MITRISHISFYTNSLVKVKKFYIKKLGLQIIHEFKNDNNQIYGLLIACTKNSYLEFFLSKSKIYNKKNSFRHLCFDVKNLKKLNKQKFNNKLKITRGKTDNILQAFSKDLEKNIIEFHEKDKLIKFNKKTRYEKIFL